MNSIWAVTVATLVKDIRLEWRSKDALNSMLFFSLLVVVIFSFSFDPTAEESREIAGGRFGGHVLKGANSDGTYSRNCLGTRLCAVRLRFRRVDIPR